MDDKTLCNLNNMVARCDGAGWSFDEQMKHCDGAVRASIGDCCMHLCDGERCDSYKAQDIAVKQK